MNLLNSKYPHLNINGAILDIHITPELPKKITSAYSFTPVQALVDTGASESCIDLKLAADLNLVSRGERRSFAGNGQDNVHQTYEISLLIEGNESNKLFPCLPSGIDLKALKTDGIAICFIIGRDILSKCIFTYDGINGTFSIQF